MKKLRLLFTQDCNRNCEGCCNKDWDLDSLPKCTDYSKYDEILITGGEPMLYPDRLDFLINKIRKESEAKIYIYTAKPTHVLIYWIKESKIDGITLTIHKEDDVDTFYLFNLLLTALGGYDDKSLRLNVFKGINTPDTKNRWKAKSNMEWIKDCPLPKDEVFMKY